MTLTSTTTRLSFSGDGGTTSFAITFVFWDKDDLRVVLRDSAGAETVWTRGSEYTVTGGSGSTGTVEATTAPASGETLVVLSNVPDTQETSLPLGGPFPSTSVEQEFDKTVRRVQQIDEEVGRALKFSETSSDSGISFPDITGNASKIFRVNAAATTLEAVEATDLGTAVLSDGAPSKALTTGTSGTGTEVSRSDHQHPLPDVGSGLMRTGSELDVAVARETRTDVTTTTIPAGTNFIRTAGYANAGDGGGALYKRVGSEPSHLFKVQSADGAWWSGIQSVSDVQARSTAGGFSRIHVGETYVNARNEFGLSGENDPDDEAKWDEIDANMPVGGTLYFPPGVYKRTTPWVITKAYHVFAEGPNATTLRYDVSAGTDAAIQVEITDAGGAGDVRQWSLRNAKVQVNDVGGGAGGAALQLGVSGFTLTALNALVEGCNLTGVTRGLHTGAGFTWLNVIRNTITEGINVTSGGDGLHIARNIIAGTTTGLTLNTVLGTYKHEIVGNAFSCRDGAIDILDATQVDILYNQIEQNGVNAHTNNMLVNVRGQTRTSYSVNIIGNNFGGGSNVNTNLRLDDAQGAVIDQNDFNGAAVQDIIFTANAKYNDLRDGNKYRTGTASYNRARVISESGVSNSGIDRALSVLYQNGWSNVISSAFRRQDNGRVVFQGTAGGGTTTAGTIVAVLPTGFAPNTQFYVPVSALDGSSVWSGTATLLFQTNGNIKIADWPAGAARFVWDGVSYNSVRQIQ